MAEITSRRPTGFLRWKELPHGEVLQQQIEITTHFLHGAITVEHEWKDVPRVLLTKDTPNA